MVARGAIDFGWHGMVPFGWLVGWLVRLVVSHYKVQWPARRAISHSSQHVFTIACYIGNVKFSGDVSYHMVCSVVYGCLSCGGGRVCGVMFRCKWLILQQCSVWWLQCSIWVFCKSLKTKQCSNVPNVPCFLGG